MIFRGSTNEFLQILEIYGQECFALKEPVESPLAFIWFEENGNRLKIDGTDHVFDANSVICLTEFHHVSIEYISKARMLRFNRPFYCIVDHDSEIGCKGILFFGASQLPVFKLGPEELEKFTLFWRMFELEMESADALQLEMLQSMLKRFIILCTRLYKLQYQYSNIENNQINIIREYNFLVELHFREKHTVAEYADLLAKSPKTLSNLFSKISNKTPLQYIQERRMLEARRLLRYTDKSVKEIGYELGYEDSQTFGRAFKNIEGLSPKEYRER
jgi:AraC family transcriptional activator of pobA